MRWVAVTMLFLCSSVMAVAAPAAMADTRGLIEQALDEPATIRLENIRLIDAMAVVTEQTGVKLVLPDEVLDFLPYGRETLVQKVEIAGVLLRQGLTELLSPLGMTFVVMDDHVRILPKEALLCLGRPPTWQELDALGELSDARPGTNAEALARLQARVQFHVSAPNPWAVLSEAIRRVGAGPGDEVLSIACASLGWGWCLSNTQIVIGSLQQRIRRQLLMPISLRVNHRPLFDVLTELGRRVNVPIRVEPGALAALPPHVRKNFSLNVSHESAELVLEKVAAFTGLGYLIEPEGVLFYLPGDGGPRPNDRKPAPASVSADPYVAKIVVELEEGRSIEWLIRRSELPDDLRKMREHDIAEGFEILRRKQPMTHP